MQQWEDVDEGPNTLEATTVGGLRVVVSLDDEGPMTPAFYWLIERADAKVADGWASTVGRARKDATRTARKLAS